MAQITSLVQFTQGLTVGAPGQSIFGVKGAAVTVTAGGVNTGVVRAVFTLVWVPKKSALTPHVLQDTSAPALLLSVNFTPDVADAYVLRVDLYDAAGNVYTDEKIFGIKRPSGKFMMGFTSSPGQWNFAENLSFDGTTFGYAKYANDWLEPRSWETVLDLDFSAQPNQNIPADGAVTIGGQAFAKLNTAGDRAALAVVNGAGLRFQPNAGVESSELLLTLSTVLPAEVLQWATGLRVWIWIEGQNFTNNGDGAFFAITTASAGFFEGIAGINGGNGQQTVSVFKPTTSTQQSNNAHPPGASTNVFVLEAPALDGVEARALAGQFGAGAWPAESTALFLSAVAVGVGGQWQDPTNAPSNLAGLVFLFGAAADAASAALTVTIGRIRVDYKV